MNYFIRCLVTCALLLVLPRANAQQEPLLMQRAAKMPDLSARETELLRNITSHVTFMKLEPVQLDKTAFSAKRFSMEIFGQNYQVKQTKLEVRGPGNFSCFGALKDGGQVILTVRGDDVLGNILIGLQYYSIATLGKGKYVLYAYDQSKFPPEECLVWDSGSKHMPAIQPGTTATTHTPYVNNSPGRKQALKNSGNITCKLRVLVMYTTAVATAVSDPRNLAQQSVDLMNTTFTNSGINYSAELAYAGKTTYVESGTTATAMQTDLTNFNADATVSTLRNTYVADVCVLFTSPNMQTCGQANQIYSDAAHAYCVVDRSCAVGNISFPHEIGHLLGCRHNTENDNTTTPFSIGHGFLNTAAGIRTIMSYPDQSASPVFTTRIPYWSSTNTITYNGTDNVVIGNATTANDAQVLGSTATWTNSTTSTTGNLTNGTIYDAVTFRSPANALAVDAGTVLDNTQSADLVANGYILNSGSFTIKTGADVSMRASTEIDGLNGLDIQEGAEVTGDIVSCATCGGDPTAGGTTHGGGASDESNGEGDQFVPPAVARVNNTKFSAAVYPNPAAADEQVHLKYSLAAAENVAIDLLDLWGQRVQSIQSSAAQTAGAHTLDWRLPALAQGMYFVRFLHNGQSHYSKLAVAGK